MANDPTQPSSAAKPAASSQSAPAPAPASQRPAGRVLGELLGGLVDLTGNHPRVKSLLDEFVAIGLDTLL